MAEESTRSRLGRGLASLIGDMGAETNAAPNASASERVRSQRRVPIEFLRPNPRNPRREFPAAQLDELASSIKERGMIQPIAVRPVRGASDAYEIIAGERRWQAAQRAGLHDVPVVVLDVSDAEALELAIVENVQREDLNALEEAAGYQALIDEFKYHQDEIAKVVGKSRSHVANTLRLLKLPEFVKSAIRAGQVSAGHARALIGHPEPERLARQIIERGLNVRQVEALARSSPGKTQPRQPRRKEADTIAIEKRVSDALGLAVTVDHRGDGGAVHIKYRNLDQLRDIVRRLERAP
ncbi:MAG TPA: ParB/RepB/Spo0J family partition protein [Xanthobacteraceae bacterium]|jgi:ParB family chromosome partitioning protein|nr:ParB/RepB/Spo0J family partition protein [Xanthobacteraceae bacterium]